MNKEKIYIILAAILIIALIIIIVMNFIIPSENWTTVLSFDGDFNGDGKNDFLEVKVIYSTDDISNNTLKDTDNIQKSAIFLNGKKVKDSSIRFDIIEVADYDNDGIDEIKATFEQLPPEKYETRCNIYKIKNNSLELIDTYTVDLFCFIEGSEYIMKGFNIISISGFKYYSTDGEINPNDELFEIQYRKETKELKIISNNQLLETISSVGYNDASFHAMYDVDSDNIRDITNNDKSIVIKASKKPTTKEDITVIRNYNNEE